MTNGRRVRSTSLFLTMFCLLALQIGNLYAQEPIKTGTTAASFLELGVGSRAVAMGEAYVAVAEGPTAGYWNPAGLGMMRKSAVTFMQMDYVADLDLQNVAIAIPIPGVFTLGAMATNLAVPEDKIRTVEDPEGTSGETFDASSLALSFLVSRQFTPQFSVGVGVKYINERLHLESASAVAFDFGVLIRTGVFNNMTLGMSLTNFGGKMQFAGENLFRQIADREDILGTNQNLPANFETDQWPLPITFRIGLATELIKRDNQRLMISVEGLHPNNTTEYVNIGGEYINSLGRFGEIALRGGYNSAFQEDSQQGLTLGGGLNIYVNPNFSVGMDYAYAEWDFFGDIHRYSVNFSF